MFWFPTIETIILLPIVWFMPKRLTRLEIYVTWSVMAALTLATDILLNLAFKLYYNETPKTDWQALILEILLPPAFGVIFLNFMPSRRVIFMAYSLIIVFLSDINELLNVHFRYITYVHWNICYSSFVYLFGMLFLRWHLHFIRRN